VRILGIFLVFVVAAHAGEPAWFSFNLYERLGVSDRATEEQIKKAYRRLVVTVHPDRNKQDPQAVQKFKSITQAWEILGDAEARRNYLPRTGEVLGQPKFRPTDFSKGDSGSPFSAAASRSH
jgi:curved DNA-binding protein CbpA